MRDVYVIGCATTPFRRWPDRSHKQLTADAVLAALTDATLAGGGAGPDSIWFGCCAGHAWGQANIIGQVLLDPLFRAGMLPQRTPVVNVEGGCATGGLAFSAAVKDVRAGDAELSLAVGVEKTFMPHNPAAMMALFDGALDQLDPSTWRAEYAEAARAMGTEYAPVPQRIQLLDVCALEARHHMARHGTTAAQIAASAAKNHTHAVHNPAAQYRTAMTVEEVLADKAVLAPLTRAMCAPISDGAAAVLVCSGEALARLPASVQARAARVRAVATTSGAHRSLDAPSLARVAADRAWERSGVAPTDVDVVELHDATSFAELYLSEMLRLCPDGEGGAYIAGGAASLGGRRPANTSGGLVSKGHPLAATGLAMVHEIVTQLRQEAGGRQVHGARLGAFQNGGGLVGFDEAACVVGVLEAAGRP